jgi:hypothetical protein
LTPDFDCPAAAFPKGKINCVNSVNILHRRKGCQIEVLLMRDCDLPMDGQELRLANNALNPRFASHLLRANVKMDLMPDFFTV